MKLAGTDLEVIINLDRGELKIELRKAGISLHRVIVEQATAPIENIWLAGLFVRDVHVRLADVSAEVSEYLAGLDISQG